MILPTYPIKRAFRVRNDDFLAKAFLGLWLGHLRKHTGVISIGSLVSLNGLSFQTQDMFQHVFSINLWGLA